MKKHLFQIFMLLAFGLFLAACSGENDDTDSQADMAVATEEAAADAVSEAPASGASICLWPKVGLRDAAGTGNGIKYMTTILFGEAVTPTGEMEEVKNATKRD